MGFALNQKLHSVTADQLYRGKFDGDDSASIERIANDVQVFLREPTADVKDQTLFSRNSIDSVRHWLAFACRLLFSMANGTPFELR